MILGNILTYTKIDVGPRYNVVKKIDDIIPELPTLVVGYNLATRINGGESPLNFEFKENMYWGFKKKTSRDEFEKALFNFFTITHEKYCDSINYVLVDPIIMNYRIIRRVVKKIHSLNDPIAYIHNNRMVYIYGENIIFGIDLQTLEYLGLDIAKIKNKIQSICGGTLLGEQVFIEYKDFIVNFNNSIKFIPYLYFKDNE